MKISIEIQNNKILTNFSEINEKEILALYETLGIEICQKFGYDYSKLLTLMLKRLNK
ncbi:MAG: hypothetical protein ACRC51_08900 [Cetobacterium sp.]